MVDVLARAWVQYVHPEDCVDGRHPRELLGNGPMGKLLVQVVRQNRQGFSGKLYCLGRCWTGCFRFWLFERECEMEMGTHSLDSVPPTNCVELQKGSGNFNLPVVC